MLWVAKAVSDEEDRMLDEERHNLGYEIRFFFR